MKHTIIALALAGLAVSTAGIAAEEPMKPSKALQAVQSNDPSDFFETTASANMFEIEAGKLAQEMGSNPAIKSFGEKMVADHTKAMGDLKKLAEKKNVTLPAAMLDRHQMLLDGLKKEKAGKEFDNEYRLKMIASHKEVVSLLDQAANKSEDADIKAFAAKAVSTPQHHGAMAKDLPKS